MAGDRMTGTPSLAALMVHTERAERRRGYEFGPIEKSTYLGFLLDGGDADNDDAYEEWLTTADLEAMTEQVQAVTGANPTTPTEDEVQRGTPSPLSVAHTG